MSSVYCIESDTTYPDLASFESAEQGAVAKTAVIDGKVTGAEIKDWTGHLTLKAKNTPYNGANSATCDGLISGLSIRNNNVTLSKDSPIFIDGGSGVGILLGTWEKVQNVFISGGCKTNTGSSTSYAIRSHTSIGGIYHIDNFIVEQSGAGIELRADATGSTINQLTVAQSAANQSYRMSLSDKSNAVVTNLLVIRDAAAVLNDIYMVPANTSSDYLATGDFSSTSYAATSSFLSTDADLVDIAGGNFNVSPSSPLYTAGHKGESVGAVMSVATGTDQNIITSTAEQLTQTQVINTNEYDTINAIVCQQDTNSQLAELTLSNQLSAIATEQITNCSLSAIAIVNTLTAINTEQLSKALTVNITSNGAQGVSVVIAEQLTQSQVASTEELQQLQAIVSQQIIQSLNTDIEQQLALTAITSEQLTQYSAQQVSIDLTVSTLIADQLTQAELINVVLQNISNQLNIDIDQISIEMLTPTYEIEMLTPTYTIEHIH